MEMTISEAEQIINIVCKALQRKSQHNYHPISSLKGYDVFQIDSALKLRIANEFLCLSGRPDFEEKFSEWIKLAESVPLLIEDLFVLDEELEKLNNLPRISTKYKTLNMDISPCPLDESMNFKDKRFASLETMSSFGDYCRHVGSKDPLFWQKIYTRIKLEHTSISPQGNTPVQR
jgi:hypothetical protein